MDIRELYWAAGMIEGEGCFTGKGATRVCVWQVQREPLERLQRLFGGTITLKKSENPRHNDASIWYVGSMQGRGIMMTLYPLLSPKRQQQIRLVLERWKLLPGMNQRQTHCQRGHALTPDNIFVAANGKTHSCRVCRKEFWVHKRAREKAERHARGLWVSGDMHWTKRNKTEEELRFCSRGHERTPENTYIWAKGNRKSCRLCRQELKAVRARHNATKGQGTSDSSQLAFLTPPVDDGEYDTTHT